MPNNSPTLVQVSASHVSLAPKSLCRYRQHLLYTTQDQVGFPIAMWKVQVLPWTLGQIKQSSLVVKHNHGERR